MRRLARARRRRALRWRQPRASAACCWRACAPAAASTGSTTTWRSGTRPAPATGSSPNCAQHADSRRLPVVTNYRNIALDILVHAQDIAIPLGLPSSRSPSTGPRGRPACGGWAGRSGPGAACVVALIATDAVGGRTGRDERSHRRPPAAAHRPRRRRTPPLVRPLTAAQRRRRRSGLRLRLDGAAAGPGCDRGSAAPPAGDFSSGRATPNTSSSASRSDPPPTTAARVVRELGPARGDAAVDGGALDTGALAAVIGPSGSAVTGGTVAVSAANGSISRVRRRRPGRRCPCRGRSRRAG